MVDLTPEQVAQGVTVAEQVAETEFPVLKPFDPMITLITAVIMAHFNATKVWPTVAQVQAALPADYQQFVSGWASWKPSGDGTLKTPA